MTSAGLSDRILAADRRGELTEAHRLAGRLVLEASRTGDLRRHVDALLLLARTHRHSRDAASLRRAREAAGLAVGLTGMRPLRPDTRVRARAELEHAACLVEGGRLDEGFVAAAQWRSDEDAALAGWAWTAMGQARLILGRTGEAVAQLSNAVAEFERAPGRRRVYVSRILLATALTRAGDLEQGAEILDADLSHWCAADMTRLRIEHHLALAENRRLRGDISGARELLEGTAAMFRSCTGMQAVKVRLHQQQAACELDWRQDGAAARRFRQAESVRAGLTAEWGDRVVPARVPRHAAAQLLRGGSMRESPAQDYLHGQLAVTAQELAGAMTNGAAAGSVALPAADPVGRSLGMDVRRIVEDAERLIGPRGDRRQGTISEQGVSALMARLEELGGVETERLEAGLLLRAGEVLASLREPRVLEAERLLRRSLVRLARLPGMGLALARANVALASTLRDAGRAEEALPFALRGVEILDAERFRMDSRRVRAAWREAQAPAFECAIDLARRCGRDDVAADLIIFSRAAGIVAESVTRLVPVPRLRYLDGSVSSLGTEEQCLFL